MKMKVKVIYIEKYFLQGCMLVFDKGFVWFLVRVNVDNLLKK